MSKYIKKALSLQEVVQRVILHHEDVRALCSQGNLNCKLKHFVFFNISNVSWVYNDSVSSIFELNFVLKFSFTQVGRSTGRVVYDNNVAACAAFQSK